jgi:hypothetical protein
MGLFKKSKRAQQVDAVMAEVGRNVELSAQVAQQGIAGSGMDMKTLLAAASSAMQPGVMEEMTAYRDRVTRLHAHGVETPATLRSIEVGEPSPMLGGTSAKLALTVQPDGASDYEVTTDQILQDGMAQALKPGERLTVKVDPDDPQCLMVWGATSTAQPAASAPVVATAAAPAPVPTDAPAISSEDMITRLAKLQELREMGAISEDEFEEKKVKLLAL